MINTVVIDLNDIIFDETIYPRRTHNPAKVQEYALNIGAIEASNHFIHISANNKLLDGRHRHLAYLKNADGAEGIKIKAYQHDISKKGDEFLKSIELNSSHGQQLSREDKARSCLSLFSEYGYSLDTIRSIVSVSKDFASKSTKSYRDAKEKELNQKIFDMFLACLTSDEISSVCKTDKTKIKRKITDFSSFGSIEPNATKSANFDEFIPPIYNIWNFAKKTNDVTHFGNSEQRIVENLLYLYTDPFDIVVDPFGGGGSTIDVCKKRLRRYFVSDRKPIIERENEIRKLDIVSELPQLNRNWSKVALTYLDPPYWKQAEGKYSESPDDLANMTLEKFTNCLSDVVTRISRKQSKGVIALLIQPTQWKAENRQYTDHVYDIINSVGNKRLVLENRISCPYSTEQYNHQMVNWAKENKKCLVLTRELIIWRINK